MLTKTKWRRDVRLAVDLFGPETVADELQVRIDAVMRYLKGEAVPADGSTIPQRLATLLSE